MKKTNHSDWGRGIMGMFYDIHKLFKNSKWTLKIAMSFVSEL